MKMTEASASGTGDDRQRIVDSEHLKLLSWAYLVTGCFSLLYSIFPMLFMVLFAVVAFSGRFAPEKKPDVVFPFVVFAVFLAVAFVASALLGGLKIYAGLCIRARQRRLYCQVVAALSCLAVPYGTILAIATLFVLQRESVASLFGGGVSGPGGTAHPDLQEAR